MTKSLLKFTKLYAKMLNIIGSLHIVLHRGKLMYMGLEGLFFGEINKTLLKEAFFCETKPKIVILSLL